MLSRETYEIRGWCQEFFKIFEITKTIYSNSERSEQFLVTECFFNLFLEVPHNKSSNKSEQLGFKLEKILGFRNMQEKLEKCSFKNPARTQIVFF